MSKVILHIDLNSFFAAVEILKNPSLKGKPIAVARDTSRSVVTTASYEAREFGVHSAMPVHLAKRLCPTLIIVDGNYETYKDYSKQFIKIVQRFTSNVEVASIDECYADVTEIISNYKKPLDLPLQIQTEVFSELGLECSIGVAPNKFLAKMASDLKKPRGITVLRLKEVPLKLWPLKIEEMRGVGKQTAPLLHQLGIHTIGDLANVKSTAELRMIFGKNTDAMIERAHGIDNREVKVHREIKSISQSTTLSTDLVEYSEIKETLLKLTKQLSNRLNAKKKTGNHLSLTIKYYDFSTRNCSKKIPTFSNDADFLYPHLLELLDENIEEKPIRLLGVGLGNFVNQDEVYVQMSLFEVFGREDL